MSDDLDPLLCRARVVKLVTDDNLMPLKPHIKMGAIFIVDLHSKQEIPAVNMEYLVSHTKIIIQEVGEGGWLPFECLELLP